MLLLLLSLLSMLLHLLVPCCCPAAPCFCPAAMLVLVRSCCPRCPCCWYCSYAAGSREGRLLMSCRGKLLGPVAVAAAMSLWVIQISVRVLTICSAMLEENGNVKDRKNGAICLGISRQCMLNYFPAFSIGFESCAICLISSNSADFVTFRSFFPSKLCLLQGYYIFLPITFTARLQNLNFIFHK